MDGRRFDDLTRRVARATTRRSLLRGLIGGGAALVATKAGTTLAQPDKVSICHWDEDEQGFVLLSVSQRGWDNGHAQHEQDEQLGSASDCCVHHFCETEERPFDDCVIGDDGFTECVCAIVDADCEGNFEPDLGLCECVCGLESCPTGFTLNSETCMCDLCTTCIGPTGQSGFCALDVNGAFACVTTLQGTSHPTSCTKVCSANSNCGSGWACVRDDACGEVAHCHPLAT